MSGPIFQPAPDPVPAQWSYSFEVGGGAQATYPGDVAVLGSIATGSVGYSSVAAFSAQIPAPSGIFVQLNGYASAGDGGGAYYTKGGVGPGPGLIQDSAGNWWKLTSYPTNVLMFGAKGNGTTDDGPAFQSAISFGGRCIVPPLTYLINTLPSIGANADFQFDIDPSALFTGSAYFPFTPINGTIKPIGTLIVSRTTQPSNISTIATAAFAVSATQPTSEQGSTVAIYAEASSANANGGNAWAANFVADDLGSANGLSIGLELNTVSNSPSDPNVQALRIVGAGAYNSSIGVEILTQTAGIYYTQGVNITDCIEAVGITQAENIAGTDGLLMQRFTDTSPVGNFLRLVNAAGNTNLFTCDVTGSLTCVNITASSALTSGGTVAIAGNSAATAAGYVSFGKTTATTATAGANGAVPSQVAGYLCFYIGATQYKLPYFNT